MSTLTIPKEYLSIDGATSDVQVDVDLKELLPDNITIAGEADSVVHVTLKVEQLKKRTISYNVLNVKFEGERENYSYSFDADHVMLEIQGLEEDLDRLQENNIELSLDVMELGPGDHQAGFDIQLDDGYELVKYDPITVHVVDKMADGAADGADHTESSGEAQAEMSSKNTES